MAIKQAYAVQAADKLLQLKKDNKIWESIEEIVKIWAASHPTEYESYLIDLTDTKETMKDKKFGTTKTKGSNLRRTLDIPSHVMYLIRKLYTPDELPMEKKFFIKWARKFPKMLVVERM